MEEDDALLQLAIALSVQGEGAADGSGQKDGEQDQKLPSQQEAGQKLDVGPSTEEMELDDAMQLEAAIAMSLQQEVRQGSTTEPGAGVSTSGGNQGGAQVQQQSTSSQVEQSEAPVLPNAFQNLAQNERSRPPEAQVGGSRSHTNPIDPEWIKLTENWLSNSSVCEISLGPGIESHRAEISAFLKEIIGKEINLIGQLDGDATFSQIFRTAFRHRPGAQIQVLSDMSQHCAAKLKTLKTDQGDLKNYLSLLQSKIGRKGLALLKDDEDDIFFEGGKVRGEFQSGLKSGTISPEFLAVLLAGSTEQDMGEWESLLKTIFRGIVCDFKDTADLNKQLYSLDLLTRHPILLRALSHILTQEIQDVHSKRVRSSDFPEASIFGSLFSISTLVDVQNFLRGVESHAKDVFVSLRGYPTNRGEVEVNQNFMRKMLDTAHGAASEVLLRVIKSKHKNFQHLGRESILTFLSTTAFLAESRTRGGERQALKMSGGTMSDKFAVGVVSVALRLCRPFLKWEDKFMQRLDAGYLNENKHRFFGGLDGRSLSGKRMERGHSATGLFSPDRPSTAAPHFVTECFFITQHLIHTCLIPALNRFSNMSEALHTKLSKKSPTMSSEEMMLFDCTTTQLLDPVLAGDAVKFVVLEAMWLLKLLRAGNLKAFDAVPDFVLHDMGLWLMFVIKQGSALLLGDVNIGLLMEALVEFIEHRDLVKSPLVLSKLVELMLTMLSPQLAVSSRGSKILGPDRTRPGEAALVAAVLGTGVAQVRLVPALMRLYSEADHVVGLDVDRDSFDKFSMRNCIDLILEELWKDDLCKASLTELATAELKNKGAEEGGLFADYIGAVLNDLMYLLKDSFDRLADIHNIEESMDNSTEWNKLPPNEKEKKMRFYEGQRGTCRGFMRLATTTLRLLNLLSSDPVVCKAFLKPPLSGRAAYGVLRFLELLVGPGCTKLQVRNPQQYNFDPQGLLASVCAFMLRLGRHSEFQQAVADEPDFDAIAFKILTKTHDQLMANHQYEIGTGLEGMISGIKRLTGKQDVAMDESASLDLDSLESRHPLDDNEADNLDALYVEQLRPLGVSDFDSTAPGSYNSAYAAFSQESGSLNPKGLKKLGREMRDFQLKQLLPIFPASSIFVRHDTDRLDKVRAMITGPEGSPYGYGCFVFDVFFPQDYPNVPPLMNLETTGQGRARFNPNLYADGKVCLSLLGTWHGAAAHEKWDPSRSNLFQILISIQGMIFVEDPYFNEPNVDIMRNTAEGSVASRGYNAEVQLNTIRWAMIDQLRRPRVGFEDVTRRHFKLMKHRIVKQCHRWIREASKLEEAFQERMVAAVDELYGLLRDL